MAKLLGIDVGGTFTDLFYLDEATGRVRSGRRLAAETADVTFLRLHQVAERGAEPSVGALHDELQLVGGKALARGKEAIRCPGVVAEERDESGIHAGTIPILAPWNQGLPATHPRHPAPHRATQDHRRSRGRTIESADRRPVATYGCPTPCEPPPSPALPLLSASR